MYFYYSLIGLNIHVSYTSVQYVALGYCYIAGDFMSVRAKFVVKVLLFDIEHRLGVFKGVFYWKN